MTLTDQEKRMIERLRKQQQRWHSAKWVMLFGGFSLGIGYLGLLCWIWKGILVGEIPNSVKDALLLFYPLIIFALGMAFWMIATAIRDWRGNITRTLLLKLLDH